MNLGIECLECKFCHSTLLPAIKLTCGALICKKHLYQQNEIKCYLCQGIHTKNDEFSSQSQLNMIIDSMIKIEITINKVRAIREHPTEFIYNFIENLNNKIDIKREEVKLEIENSFQQLVEDIQAYLRDYEEISEEFKREHFKSLLNRIDKILPDISSIRVKYSEKEEIKYLIYLINICKDEILVYLDEARVDLANEFESIKKSAVELINTNKGAIENLWNSALLFKDLKVNSISSLEPSELEKWKTENRDIKQEISGRLKKIKEKLLMDKGLDLELKQFNYPDIPLFKPK